MAFGKMLLEFRAKYNLTQIKTAEILGVTTEGYELHNAKDDSLVCATLLKRFYNAERFLGYVRDTTNPEFYRRLCFKPYYITL